MYEFVPVSIQPSTYAIAPTPVSAIIILPIVELSGMIRLYGDGAWVYGMSNIIHRLEKSDFLTVLPPLSDHISHPRTS